MVGNEIAFFVLAFVAVASAFGVITMRHPVYSMLSLILNLLSLALFFLMLDAIFVATIQVLIYAGAVMVLFLFVVTMLAPEARDTSGLGGRDRLRWQWAAGAGLAVILAGALIVAALSGAIAQDAQVVGTTGLAQQIQAIGNTETFGEALFHGYAFPFELTGVLLVIAVLGAVVLGRRLARNAGGGAGGAGDGK